MERYTNGRYTHPATEMKMCDNVNSVEIHGRVYKKKKTRRSSYSRFPNDDKHTRKEKESESESQSESQFHSETLSEFQLQSECLKLTGQQANKATTLTNTRTHTHTQIHNRIHTTAGIHKMRTKI